MNISGIWEGEYIYGEGYPVTQTGKAIKFTVYLTANGSEVHGTFADEETREIFPEGGILVGVAENNYLSITKQYPCAWGFDEAGEIVLQKDFPSQYIIYEGYFTDDKFEGNWEIPLYDPDTQYESIYDYEHVGGSGSWWMKRKE